MAEIHNYCYADACTEEISGGRLMCRRHWDMVPYDLQGDISHLYHNAFGTKEYFNAINAARGAVRDAITSGGKP